MGCKHSLERQKRKRNRELERLKFLDGDEYLEGTLSELESTSSEEAKSEESEAEKVKEKELDNNVYKPLDQTTRQEIDAMAKKMKIYDNILDLVDEERLK